MLNIILNIRETLFRELVDDIDSIGIELPYTRKAFENLYSHEKIDTGSS